MATWKRKKILFCVAAIVLIIAGAFLTGWGTLSMSFVDFPVDKLPSLDTSIPLTTQTNQITGEGACALRSSMTAIVGRFMPGITFVDVLINGTACSLMVDTGCADTALFPRLAKQAHVPISKAPIGTLEQSEMQFITPYYQGLVTNLVLGNFTISNVPVHVCGKQHEERLLGVPVYHMDGFLGMDILQNFAVTFVLSDNSVRFSRNVHVPAPEAKQVPFRMTNCWMICSALVNGQPVGDCLVDSGSSSRLKLPEAAWNKLALGETGAQVDLQIGEIDMKQVAAEKSKALDIGMIPMNILATKGTKTITIDFLAKQIIYE